MKQLINNFLARKNILVRKLLPRPSVLFAKEHFKEKLPLQTNNPKEPTQPLEILEIGTYEGHNAKSMFEELYVVRMVCVDPYLMYANDEQLDYALIEKAKKKKDKILKDYLHKIHFIEQTSRVAYGLLRSYKFDFIYLDGDHRYEEVKHELNRYWDLLEKRGIIAGHDVDHVGVFEAVGEFCLENNLKLNLRFPDWWIVK